MARPLVPNRPARATYKAHAVFAGVSKKRLSQRRYAKTYSVQICVGAADLGHVEVDDNVDALNVNTTSHQVRCHQDAFLEILELLDLVQPEPRKRRTGRELAFNP